MLAPKRITPPISPRSMRPSRSAVAVVPDIRTTSFWPISWASVGVAVVVAGTVVVAVVADPARGDAADGLGGWTEHATVTSATRTTPATRRITWPTGASRSTPAIQRH